MKNKTNKNEKTIKKKQIDFFFFMFIICSFQD
jgi:hypothetical protein